MAKTPPQELTLANLQGGALMETATRELRRIAENIQDPNTDPKAKRELTIKVVLEPDDTRQMIKMTTSAQAKLPGPDAGKSVALVGMMPGTKKLALFEAYTAQELFPDEEEAVEPPIQPLKQARA